MLQKPTDELNDILENAKPGELGSYLKENEKYLADEKKAFYYHFKDVLDEKSIKLNEVYLAADVSESYGSKIIRMEKHTKNRDMIIRLCLAGHFSWKETDRALKLYGMSNLYAKDPRDACLIVAIKNRIFDPEKIDELLVKEGLKKLSKDE